jgi:hypothetical protein
MDLFTTLAVLRRRWYAIAPVLLLAVVAEVLLPTRIPVSYRWNASVLLVPPATSGAKADATNPYLSFDQSLIVAASVVAKSVTDPASVAALKSAGASAPFTVDPPVSDIPNPSPILEVSVEDTNTLLVTRTAESVVAAIGKTLRSQQGQAGAPAASLIKPVVVSHSAGPVAVVGRRHRAEAAIGALAVVLLVGTAFLVEAVDTRRAQQRHVAVRRPAPEPRPQPELVWPSRGRREGSADR